MYLLLFIVNITYEVAIPSARSFQNVSSHAEGRRIYEYLQTFDFCDNFLPNVLLEPL